MILPVEAKLPPWLLSLNNDDEYRKKKDCEKVLDGDSTPVQTILQEFCTFDRKKMAASAAAAAQNKILQGIFISAHEEEAKKPKKKKRER